MTERRPTPEDLTYVGFTELQRILISDLPARIAWDAYYEQLNHIMSDDDNDVDF